MSIQNSWLALEFYFLDLMENWSKVFAWSGSHLQIFQRKDCYYTEVGGRFQEIKLSYKISPLKSSYSFHLPVSPSSYVFLSVCLPSSWIIQDLNIPKSMWQNLFLKLDVSPGHQYNFLCPAQPSPPSITITCFLPSHIALSWSASRHSLKLIRSLSITLLQSLRGRSHVQ